MTELEQYKKALINDIEQYIYSDKELEVLKDRVYIVKCQNEAYKLIIGLIENRVY